MKHVVNLAGAIVIGLVMYLVGITAESALLKQFVSGFPETMDRADWLAIWTKWAAYSLGAGLITFCLWYLLGQFLQPDFTGRSSKRPVWIVLLVVPALTAVVGVLKLPAVESNGWLADLLLFANGLLTYWAISALFSPSLVKTDPVLARRPRAIRESTGI